MFWKKRETRHEFTFVGGPLDGYQQQMAFRPATILAFPVDQNLLAALQGDEPPAESRITSVAFYEGAQTESQAWRFRFVCATSPRDAELAFRDGFSAATRPERR